MYIFRINFKFIGLEFLGMEFFNFEFYKYFRWFLFIVKNKNYFGR